MNFSDKRETLGSRLGFIFLSAGCAIGLGNIWRFPFITGHYGGAAFIFIYLIFLILIVTPIMAMEFATGRASHASSVKSFKNLCPDHKIWSAWGWIGWAGNIILLMFYTVITGWMLAYTFYSAVGYLERHVGTDVANFFVTHIDGLSNSDVNDIIFSIEGRTLSEAKNLIEKLPHISAENISSITNWLKSLSVGYARLTFENLISSPHSLLAWMGLTVLISFCVCFPGLKSSVERITKIMMTCLLIIMFVLAVRSLTLDGSDAGLKFYLQPDFEKLKAHGIGEALYAALGQAFFTLSVGMGSMAIFGSYISKNKSLTGESLIIAGLDTVVALTAGLIIFPGLLFVTLPNTFAFMPHGRIWSTLFFLFMSFAALSTVIAVTENIIAGIMDSLNLSRQRSCVIACLIIFLFSIPCALGFNLWSDVQPLGEGSMILDLEDFIVSNNLLPLGAIIYLLFCTTKYGWGWDNFIKEADTGNGLKFPKILHLYFKYVIPVIMLIIFIFGYYEKFF